MKLPLVALTAAAVAVAIPASAETLSAESQAAKEQLAAQLGVDPSAYDYHTLVQLNCRLMGADNEAEKTRLLANIDDIGKQHPKPGEDAAQLAASLGVDASKYSLSQLVYLKGLMEGRSCSLARAEQIAKGTETFSTGGAAAKEQLASLMGVNPADYTLNELVKMKWESEGGEAKAH